MRNHAEIAGEANHWGSEADAPEPITLEDVRAARATIAAHLSPTPLVSHPRLSERVGATVHVKLENAQSIGAFKIRGALNLLAAMSEEERARGIVTATKGNHGIALARACSMHGVACTVLVPQGNNPDKNAAMEAWGAEVIVGGHDFDAAWDAAVRHARSSGATCIHPAKSRPLVAGQGTVALELLEQAPSPLAAVFVPVGGGSIAASTAVVVKALSPETEVICVQAENAPAFHHAWHTHEYRPIVTADTVADGLAARIPVRYTLEVLERLADDFLLVSEEEICAAIRCCHETIHQLAEGAGAAPLAGLMQVRERYAGREVAFVLTGGNIDVASFVDAVRGAGAGRTPQAMPHFPLASLDYGD